MLFLFPTCRNEPLTHAYVISGGKSREKSQEKSRQKSREKSREKSPEKSRKTFLLLFRRAQP